MDARRLVDLLESLDVGGYWRIEDGDVILDGRVSAQRLDEALAGMTPLGMVRVVTRYGNHKHLAHRGLHPAARHQTLCRGTSSWTVESWENNPDHPRLTLEQIKALPDCPACAAVSS